MYKQVHEMSILVQDIWAILFFACILVKYKQVQDILY